MPISQESLFEATVLGFQPVVAFIEQLAQIA